MDSKNKLRVRTRLADRLRDIAKRKRKQPVDVIHLALEIYADSEDEKYFSKVKSNV